MAELPQGEGALVGCAASLKKVAVALALTAGLATPLVLAACANASPILTLATTTSTADSGLLDAILPPFEEEANATVKVLAVGTGQALALGERGDADVLLVHDPGGEAAFVAQGFGTARYDVMYNDFVIIGPPEDPAGVAWAGTAAEAVARVAEVGAAGQAVFVSRGDQSGTHRRELGVWEEAGLVPKGAWYRTTGQGMGDTLTIAHELKAYTLSDRGTYLSQRRRLALVALLEGDPILFNPYGVIPVNPERHPKVQHDLAVKFVEYVTRYETQERIGRYGTEQFGEALFHPNSEEWWQGRSGGK